MFTARLRKMISESGAKVLDLEMRLIFVEFGYMQGVCTTTVTDLDERRGFIAKPCKCEGILQWAFSFNSSEELVEKRNSFAVVARDEEENSRLWAASSAGSIWV